MKEQEQVEFYDRLLLHLNKNFLNNYKIQELYLDLARNTRKLKFNSIKNIYTTLTQGKADQIIYRKDKPALNKSQVYDAGYAKRTCWRVVQKLITKIAYYLTYQRRLNDLAPTILRAISYAQKATYKINNKSLFLQFFSEIVDLLIEENNILAKRIYGLLIQRGYIYSVDQFYKLSRFQEDKDFVYKFESDQEGEDGKLKQNLVENNEEDRRKKGFMSGKRLGGRGSLFKTFGNQFSPDLLRKSLEIKQKDEDGDSNSESDSQSSPASTESKLSQVEQLQQQRVNKINHEIHNKIDKLVNEFTHHPNYDIFLSSVNQDHIRQKRRTPIVSQLIKNIRLKNFKANQKILQMSDGSVADNTSDRKNSNQNMTDSKRSKIKNSATRPRNNTRTSIAMTVNKMVKENIMKKQFSEVNDIVIKNLDKNIIQKNLDKLTFEDIDAQDYQKCQFNDQKTFKKTLRRQNTTNLDFRSPSTDFPMNSSAKKQANLQFLNHAFIFKKGQETNCYIKNNTKSKKGSIHGEDLKPIEKIITQNASKFRYSQDQYQIKSGQNNEGGNKEYSKMFSNQRLCQANKFNEFSHKSRKNLHQQRVATSPRERFNVAMLELTAKKYHRPIQREDSFMVQIEKGNLFDFKKLTIGGEKEKVRGRGKLQEGHGSYLHHRKFQIFDRRSRKIL